MRAVVAAVLVWSVTGASAQVRAQVSGFVRDSSGAMVRDAAIAVLNLDTGVRRSVRSNNEGFFAISSLTPGQYKITARKDGFQTVARTGVALGAFDSTRLDFLLEPGSLHEEITVTGTIPLANTTDAGESWRTGRLPAELLPVNGRGLQALIDLAPGVLTTPATAGEAGQFSANGQRPATNYFMVDGVGANNGVSGSGLPGQFSGAALPAMTAMGSLHNLVTLGELDEMRIGTSTYAPEFGRLPGAQIAVSTRSGSNEFHGEIFGSLRHRNLAAADPFARSAGLPYEGRLLNGGATAAGPIVRNRTFFHLSTEHIRLRQPATFLSVVPSMAARNQAPVVTRAIVHAFPIPNGPELTPSAALHTAQIVNPSTVDSSAARVDHTLGSAGSLFVRYNRAPSSSESGFYNRNAAHFSSQTITTGILAALGPNMTFDGRIGFSRNAVGSEWLPGAANLDLRRLLPAPTGAGQALYGIGIRGVGQLVTGDAGRSRQHQWNFAGSAAFTKGRHDVRFGFDYLRLSPSRESPITSVTSLFDSLDRLVFGAIPTYIFAQTGGGSSVIETTSLFVQDTWHITPRLNLTFGMRQEITPAPSYRGPAEPGGETVVSPNPLPAPPGVNVTPEFLQTPQWKTRAGQLAPRAGLAWQFGENWVLRAGAGLFYDLGFSSAVDLVNGAPYNRFRSMLASIGSINSFEDSVQYGFAADLKLPRTAHWNVTVEKMLSRDSTISAGYVGAAGDRLMRREGYTDLRSGRPRLILATNSGESSYHSLQIGYRSRDVRGLLGTISYTWSHAIDNGSWDSASYLVFNGASDRGSSNFDVRHSFQAALAYDMGRTGLRLVRGWTLSGALRLRTGFPIDVVTSDHPFGLGFDNDLRPDLVPGVPMWLDGRLNPAAFTRPAGFQGTLGRNAISGRSLGQLDLALARNFVLTERFRLSFRTEAYNVANSPQLADPVRVLASPMFGFAPSTASLMLGMGRPNVGLSPAFQSGGPRVIQLGVTLRF